MATKITGYQVSISTGGNKCVQCGTRMRKGLPYLTPIRGKRVIHEVKGKSICVTCINELMDITTNKLQDKDKDLEKYERRRFLEHLD